MKSGWQPIETAPEDKLLVVGWVDQFGQERYEFDIKEDGVWVEHANRFDKFLMVATMDMIGPEETPPYTHWVALQPLPPPPGE